MPWSGSSVARTLAGPGSANNPRAGPTAGGPFPAMPVLLNLNELTETPILLEGLLPVPELDWGGPEDLVALSGPLHYRFTVRREGEILLLVGALTVDLDCLCARCLKPFRSRLTLDPWSVQLELSGPEAIPQVGELADLTPCLREDTVLALPQRPLCAPDCSGWPASGRSPTDFSDAQTAGQRTVWSALDKLKF